MMDLRNNRKINIIIIYSIISIYVLSIGLNLFYYFSIENINKPDNFIPMKTSNSNDFNILRFWESEIKRVNNTPLNIILGKNSTIKYINSYTKVESEFIAQKIQFDSPNWVGANPSIITLSGYLLYPKEIKSKNPGCLCMHGIDANANSSFNSKWPLALPYLEEGFIVLCHSHPGHGESEGAQPTPQNMFFPGEYNKSIHGYLTLCGAIQGLRILENLTLVNNSEIMVTGFSYGALNTMWLSSICGERIRGALPYCFVGDFEKTITDRTKLLFWILGENSDNIPVSLWENLLLRIDPTNYLKSEILPPILWQVGTTDEWFHYSSINKTYSTVQKNESYLQIYPNGHHGFPHYENTTKYFINYILNDGPTPLKIDIKDTKKGYDLLGDILTIQVELDTNENIESVKVVYKYVDIIGTSWEELYLKKFDNNIWTGILEPGIVSSKIDYYIIVNLEGEENIWFSSRIYTAGLIISNLTIPFYILLISFIFLPVGFIIWREYKKNVSELDISTQFEPKKNFIELKVNIQQKSKRNFIIYFSIMGATELIFFISLMLPMIVSNPSGLIWTNEYLYNNVYTWDLKVGELAPYLTLIFVISWILYFHLSLKKPMLSSLFKIIYPLYVIYLSLGYFGCFNDPSSLYRNFGLFSFGIGLYLMLISAFTPFFIGIWKRIYQTKFGIRIPKTKFYNIDRWFRIKSPFKLKKLIRNRDK